VEATNSGFTPLPRSFLTRSLSIIFAATPRERDIKNSIAHNFTILQVGNIVEKYLEKLSKGY
jgi:hypothetical protein